MPVLSYIKLVREGEVFWIQDSAGNALFERRPESNMLGGMVGLPSTNWDDKTNPLGVRDDLQALLDMSALLSKRNRGVVRHSFTHFHLKLNVNYYVLDQDNPVPDPFFWISKESLNNLALPTLFKKVVKMMTL